MNAVKSLWSQKNLRLRIDQLRARARRYGAGADLERLIDGLGEQERRIMPAVMGEGELERGPGSESR